MSELILMGGGGHCRSAIDVIEVEGIHRIIGVLEDQSFEASEVMGYPVLGTDENLPHLMGNGIAVMVTVGQIKTSQVRERAFAAAKKAGASQPVIVSPKAYCSRHAHIGDGTMVMHGAVINTGCEIGQNCIVNSMALLEHDVSVGDHTHIATGARVNGGVKIGPRCFIGSGAVLHNDIEIGEGAVISAGSIVRSSVATRCLYKDDQRSKAHA
ncbi:MAG: NeuD/PglB/VioB family sugar acetyltransferase [Luminiphilus sp.]|nr:NeuD/PglB/VioB family sugar acetyltransferase [Luminiphilus sp.]